MSKKYSKFGVDLTQRDLDLGRSKMAEANTEILQLEQLEDILRSAPERGAYITLTKKRIGQLLNEMLEKPLTNDPNDLIWHGEVRGRLMEQIRNANTLQGIAVQRGRLSALKDKLSAGISNMLAKSKGRSK